MIPAFYVVYFTSNIQKSVAAGEPNEVTGYEIEGTMLYFRQGRNSFLFVFTSQRILPTT